jgi:metallo-beta-lactamase family protein
LGDRTDYEKYALSRIDDVYKNLQSGLDGLTQKNAENLLKQHGLNTLPSAKKISLTSRTILQLKNAINRTIARKGKVLIPSFTLERTQEVIYFLNELLKEKAIPVIPIFVDSPLAIDITELFKHHLGFLDEKTRSMISQGQSPFEFLNLRFIRNQQDSKALNTDKRPMIIIAGSGMCESGRILHHLINNIEDSRNTILVVGYMAEATLGRKIVDRERLVHIFGVEYELNAEVVIINAFSGHADKFELLDFVSECLPLERVFLVHGDLDQTQAFLETLHQKGINAYIPYKNEEVLLD